MPPVLNQTGWLKTMLLIRRTEEALLDLYAQGKLGGTVHTSLGQESCAAGVVSALNADIDFIWSNHRCHGHYLAYGGPLEGLLAEVMGRTSGICRGVGGSQHLHYRNFYSNGIQGGICPPAVGMALAAKVKGEPAIACVFIGDGTLGQGAVYESFNLASLWGAPVLFVVEANGFAQSTPTANALAGDMAARPRAFGIETVEIAADGPEAVHRAASELVDRVRTESRPACLALRTYRLGPHSKGDDFRDQEELEAARRADPLNRMLAQAEDAETMDREVKARIAAAIAEAERSPELSGDRYHDLNCRMEG